MTTENAQSALKGRKKQKRSPLYPYIGLKDAIERARRLYGQIDEHEATVDVAAQCWGQSPKSSAVRQIISALKQFGLVSDQGRGDDRQIKLTDLALDILVHNEESSDRLAAIKISALKPRVHNELWEKYDGKIPPNDEIMRVYLVRQRPDFTFNRSYVNDFITQFRDTIAFAKLSKSDIISTEDDGEDGDRDEKETGRKVPKARKSRTVTPGTNEDVFTLSAGAVVFQWPSQLSQDEYDDTTGWLELIKRKLQRAVVEDTREGEEYSVEDPEGESADSPDNV